MKVAFIVSKFPVLSETFIFDQVTGLIDAGCDVRIFAARGEDGTEWADERRAADLKERVTYWGVLGSRPLRFWKTLQKLVLNVHKGPMTLLRVLTCVRLDQIMESFSLAIPFLEERFDIIYCHFGVMGILGAYLKKIGMPGKLVTVFHGFDVSRVVREHGKEIYKDLFSVGDLFLPVSERWKKELIEMGCDREKTVVHHMGVDTDVFSYTEKNTTEIVKILTVARMVEKKGHRYAISAVERLLAEGRKVEYIIVGDGPLRLELERMAASAGIEKSVIFIGSISRAEVLQLYRDADILLQPSVTASSGDQEGIPVSLMEAMATGLPVASTLHSGIPELVEDGVSGILAPEKDAAALAAALARLIDEPETRVKMGRAGRTRVEKDFNSAKQNTRLLQLFRTLL